VAAWRPTAPETTATPRPAPQQTCASSRNSASTKCLSYTKAQECTGMIHKDVAAWHN